MDIQDKVREYYTIQESTHMAKRISDKTQVETESIGGVLLYDILLHSKIFGYDLLKFIPHKDSDENIEYGVSDFNAKYHFNYHRKMMSGVIAGLHDADQECES
jgi:hypothetical protein